MSSKLRILFLAAEVEPFVKVGGLGDVAGTLPWALRTTDPAEYGYDEVDIRVVLPFHNVINKENLDLKTIATLEIPHADGPLKGEVLHMEWRGLPVYFIAGTMVPDEGPVYSGDGLIDGNLFAFFSLAALSLSRELDWSPDVIHANDWHAALAVYWLSLTRTGDPFFDHTATLLNLHNLPYLGVGTQSALSAFGIPPAAGSALPVWAQQMPLPLGLLSADQIVAVSPGYASEILTPEFGTGLDTFLQTREDSISGILNGIQLADWDPETDSEIPARFSLASLPLRTANKSALQREVGLPDEPNTMLFSLISRLVHQKGVDLALNALQQLGDQNWQAIILGTGEPALEAEARLLQETFPDCVRSAILFDSALSRRIYAGADVMLIPSRYEPCGLTQMIAMRYGCVPVARATGGLLDTIQDYSQAKTGTGFLFQDPTPEALVESLQRTLQVYKDKRRWQGLQRRGMRKDFSWERSAQKYLELYISLVKRRAGKAK